MFVYHAARWFEYQPDFTFPFEQTKVDETVTQIIDPKADEIAHTIHIGNVVASVRAKMISTVLKLACQIGKYAHN